MLIFRQNNFQGLTTEVATTKLGEGYYPLLINGRIRRNVVSPVRQHLSLSAPSGKKQAIFAHGDWLVLFNSGQAWYKDTSLDNSPWVNFDGFPQLDEAAEYIYPAAIPLGTSKLRTYGTEAETGDASLTSIIFDNDIFNTPSGLLVCDGKNQPPLILPNGKVTATKAYAEWSMSDNSYVPIGIMPTLSGSKLYMLSPDRKQLYHSVTGRPLDFMVNLGTDGVAGGDVSTVSKTVTFADLTAVLPSMEGGLILATLYNSYGIALDYDRPIFGEPYLADFSLFPVGAVNHLSHTDILGDTAFITQSGIHSFNMTAQARAASNNFPLGAPIEELLDGTQEGTCAITVDTYAYFSVKTIYGYAVLVMDTKTKQWISIDTSFGRVKQFALARSNGRKRLFFITHDDEVYEAFAGNSNSLCQVYLGDFSGNSPTELHKTTGVHSTFTNIKGSVTAQVTVYGDGEKVQEYLKQFSSDVFDIAPPKPVPFPVGRSTKTIDCQVSPSRIVHQTGVFLEWEGEASLNALGIHGTQETAKSLSQAVRSTPVSEIFAVTADHGINSYVGEYLTMTKVAVTVGDTYVVIGTVHFGDRTAVNTYFTATSDTVYVLGKLWNMSNFFEVFGQYTALENLTGIIVPGDIFMNDGTETEVQRQRIFWAPWESRMVTCPGNHDLDTTSGKYYHAFAAQPSVWSRRFVTTEVFSVNTGIQTNGTELLDITSAGQSANRLRTLLAASTAKFKIVILHHPPYSDQATGIGHAAVTELRWPYKAWGANLVISGHNHNYQRRAVDGLLYVIAGTGGSQLYTVAQSGADFVYDAAHGYLKLTVTQSVLRGQFINVSNEVKDEFAINL